MHCLGDQGSHPGATGSQPKAKVSRGVLVRGMLCQARFGGPLFCTGWLRGASPLFEPPPTQTIFSCGLLALIVKPSSSQFPCGGLSRLEVAEAPQPSGWNVATGSFSLEFLKEVNSGLLEMETCG